MDGNQAPAERVLAGMHPVTKLLEEPDVFSLIFNAQSPYKLAFQKFLFTQVLPKLWRNRFYALPDANVQQANEGYWRQPHKLEYADCVCEGNKGTAETKLQRKREKLIEWKPLKDPEMQRRGQLGPPVAKRNRQIMMDRIASLLHQNADLTAEKTDLEFQIVDLKQANKGLAQTIKDMQELRFEWRERLEERHKKKV